MPGYDGFRCIADQCSFTCCMQWKISVDEKTEALWKERGRGECVTTVEDSRVIRLNEERNCPYLTDNKLCSLVIKEGDDAIPHTCKIFPRQVHVFKKHTENALVACCPEVLDLMKTLKPSDWTFLENVTESFVLSVRNEGMKVCLSPERKGHDSVRAYFYILLDLLKREKTVKRSGKYEEKMKNFLKDDISELPALLKAISGLPHDPYDSLTEVNELLLDLSENYREKGIYTDVLEPVCELAEALEEEGICEEDVKDRKIFNGWISSYDAFFKEYLVCELFADGLLPDSDLTDLTVMIQWIAMEYAAIRHAIFLLWREKGKNLSWEEIRTVMVVFARMTGYDIGDIYEFFENSFDDVVWEWGYLDLILALD